MRKIGRNFMGKLKPMGKLRWISTLLILITWIGSSAVLIVTRAVQLPPESCQKMKAPKLEEEVMGNGDIIRTETITSENREETKKCDKDKIKSYEFRLNLTWISFFLLVTTSLSLASFISDYKKSK